MILTLLTGLVLMSTLLTACSEEDDPAGPGDETTIRSDAYYPLNPGATWRFGMYTVDEGTATLQTYMDKVNDSATTLGGYDGVTQITYFISLTGDTNSQTAEYTYALVNDTVKQQYPGSDGWRVAGAAALIPWHEPGDTIFGGAGQYTWTAYVCHDTTITVPAGTFENCAQIQYYYSSGPDTYIDNYFYAPGVGKVYARYRWITMGEESVTTDELLEYSVE